MKKRTVFGLPLNPVRHLAEAQADAAARWAQARQGGAA